MAAAVTEGYELLERIGSGGFGAVYRAYQSTIGRDVAVKVILPHFANRPDFIRRFEAEAQLVARLEHLHIVPLYDYWREPDGAYLVMRWLRGGSLKDALRDGPFALEPAALLLDQVAAALAVAHTAEVVHRDLKPANVLLDEEGNAYLADFGIALDLRRGDGETVAGSPAYLAPEQIRGEAATPQTDIYSLGVTLYELLSGAHPFPDLNAVELLYKQINDPLPPLATANDGVREDVNAVIQRATAKDPRQRYDDALSLAAAFRKAARLKEREAEELIDLLTQREQEVMELIAAGLTNRQIAQELTIEHSTVKWYIRQIYGKLGVRGRRQAIARFKEMEAATSPPAGAPAEATDHDVSLPPPQNPYKGLRPFAAADQDHFFGREGLVARLLDRLTLPDGERPSETSFASGRFLAVVGPSGSGKSSLVHAGLIPALWDGRLPGSERWFVVDFTPGARPLDELEVALIRVAADQAGNLRGQLERDASGLLRAAGLILPQDDTELVLVIDQFEELFSLAEEEAERTHFLRLLTTAVTDPHSRIRVVLTLRADYYDRPLHFPDFGQLVRRHMETVLPLKAGELEQAIVRPAGAVGVTFEPGLAATIIDDVLYQPGALPLLQYALTELFAARDGRTLTHAAYQAIGGATGALARRAEELYREQDPPGRELIRQLFLRLVSVGEGDETDPDTRRRVPQSELMALGDDEDSIEELIDIFAAYRLLTLDHDPASRRPTVEIAHEALLREWERLRGWLADSRDDLYQHRRLQTLTAEWSAAGRADGLLLRQARLDQFAAWAGETDLALNENAFAFNADGALLATASQDRTARVWTLAENDGRSLYTLGGHETGVMNVLFAQNGERLVTGDQAGLIRVWNITPGGSRELFTQQYPGALFRLDHNPAQGQFATTGLDGQVQIWDADQGDPLHTWPAHDGQAYDVAYSPDGRFLATSGSDNQTIVWDVASGERQFAVSGHEEGVAADVFPNFQAVAYSPDGRHLATGGTDGRVKVWDAATGDPIPLPQEVSVTNGGSPMPIINLAYSPDGRHLLVSGDGDAVTVFDAASGEVTLTFPAGFRGSLAFSPDGTRLAIGNWDGALTLYDFTATVEDGRPALLQALRGHTNYVNSLAFSPDGDTLVSGSLDGDARMWAVDGGEPRFTLRGSGAGVADLRLLDDGRTILTIGLDGSVRAYLAQTADLVALAQTRLTRWWRPDECRRYLHQPDCPPPPENVMIVETATAPAQFSGVWQAVGPVPFPYLQFREDNTLVMADSLAALDGTPPVTATFAMDAATLQVTNTRCGDAVGAYTVRLLHAPAGEQRIILSMQSDPCEPRWGLLAHEFVRVER